MVRQDLGGAEIGRFCKYRSLKRGRQGVNANTYSPVYEVHARHTYWFEHDIEHFSRVSRRRTVMRPFRLLRALEFVRVFHVPIAQESRSRNIYVRSPYESRLTL